MSTKCKYDTPEWWQRGKSRELDQIYRKKWRQHWRNFPQQQLCYTPCLGEQNAKPQPFLIFEKQNFRPRNFQKLLPASCSPSPTALLSSSALQRPHHSYRYRTLVCGPTCCSPAERPLSSKISDCKNDFHFFLSENGPGCTQPLGTGESDDSSSAAHETVVFLTGHLTVNTGWL